MSSVENRWSLSLEGNIEASNGREVYEIYSDGGCLPNGRGAWAYLIYRSGVLVAEGSGREDRVCNNRMEFTAAVEALTGLPAGSVARINTDSRILIDSATRDLAVWKAAGWLRKSGRPVIFPELMLKLDRELTRLRTEWHWVRARSGNPDNERCDAICRGLLKI